MVTKFISYIFWVFVGGLCHENMCSMACKSLIRHIATHDPGHLVGGAALQVGVADEPGERPLGSINRQTL